MGIPRVSVCIIVKNEEKLLPGCIESVQPVSNEIIILDTGSDDNTIQVAENYGCKVIRSFWENDFSKARNSAISYATNQFILSIDADERLENPDFLLETINSASVESGGWLVDVVSESINKNGGKDVFVSSLLRLFRNHNDIRFKGVIHEQIAESIINLGFIIHSTKISLRHIGYGLSESEMNQKHKRNLDLLNIAMANNIDSAYNYYQRAKTLFALGDYQNAENDISRCIKIAPDGGSVKPQALNWGAIIAFNMEQYDKAEGRARESINIVSSQAFPNFILAEINFAKSKFGEAYDRYSIIDKIKADIQAKIIGDVSYPPELLAYKKGRCMLALKMYGDALREFEKGLVFNPNDVSCIIGAANVAFNYKKFDESKSLLLRAKTLSPNNKNIDEFLKQADEAINNTKVNSNLNSEPSGTDKNGEILLSLSMILKDEEANLEDCLKSVQGIVDEIVIIDTGSVDRTKQIAEKYSARIYDFKWINDFAAARNESLKRCKGKWILYLDADERLSNNEKFTIREILGKLPDEIGGLICTLESDHSLLSGKSEIHRGGYPRIFRNYGFPAISFTGRVHEQISPSITALGKSFLFSDIIITHLGYNRTKEEMEQKVKRNYSMLIEHVKEEPLNAYAWYQLGQTLAQMQLIEQAEQTIRFAIESGNLSNSVMASACATLAQLTGNQKKFDEALYWAEKSLDKAPEQLYALHLKAYALMYLERFEDAEIAFYQTLELSRKKKGVPLSGFDIVVPEELILKGMDELKQKKSAK